MGTFKDFLAEEENLLAQISALVHSMDEEELNDFGNYLYDEFFAEDGEDPSWEEYSEEDIQDMIAELGDDMYEYIFDMLSWEDSEDNAEQKAGEDNEMDEGVSRIMKTSNMNRKKRKFMGVSKAELRRTKAVRKKEARLSRAERKRSYRANKAKIKSYQASRNKAIKKGKHIVKLRKAAG